MPKPTVLDQEQIATALVDVPGWSVADGALHRSFELKDFSEAFGFMARVALIAEKMDHHPDWSNSWNTVDIAIASHDAGGVTQQCIDFATKVNALL